MTREPVPPITHERVWNAIDAFAARQGLTPSGLARLAGLDPTTFNRSKRHGGDGRPRWPSTESIAKVLQAVGARFDEFVGLVEGRDGPDYPMPARTVPFIDAREASAPGFFDPGGRPTGTGWDAVAFPAAPEDPLFAIEVAGSGMQPLYRDGDVIIVRPDIEIRRGDRVLIQTPDGTLTARVFLRRTKRSVEVAAPNSPGSERLALTEIAWLARIVWASQ
ncbi:DNA-binding protein [Prosthecomicrobium hirschii]|uniref:S24 family peptidase n=1 Tax=Prosthecodimorpha hirschii TaxID=665126 RepID=UPI00112631B0|nr:helix-turn-helix transcriptional regulator [Prosthecomicrobium hirschii]TPQ50454.1 DNA-binding protein [Prosthecomicrobium hirschii]